MKINNKFNLGEKVKIQALKVNGLVIAMYISLDFGLQYYVRYFINGDVKTVYFFESELETFEENKQKGFSNSA